MSLARQRLSATLAIAALAPLVATADALAQYTGTPFDPWTQAYQSSSLPVYSRVGPGGSIRMATPPGMGVVPGIGGGGPSNYPVNAFGYGAPLFGAEFDRGLFAPYGGDDAHRAYDHQFGRLYRPNAQADRLFAEGQHEREQLYFDAMNEPDPARRAEMLRRFRELSRRVSRSLSSTSARADRPDAAGSAEVSPAGSFVPDRVQSYDDLLIWSQSVSIGALDRLAIRD